MSDKYGYKIEEITQITHTCYICNSVIEIINVDGEESAWDYCVPRKEICPKCGNKLPRHDH